MLWSCLGKPRWRHWQKHRENRPKRPSRSYGTLKCKTPHQGTLQTARLTFSSTSADYERGFSSVKITEYKYRNKLHEKSLFLLLVMDPLEVISPSAFLFNHGLKPASDHQYSMLQDEGQHRQKTLGCWGKHQELNCLRCMFGTTDPSSFNHQCIIVILWYESFATDSFWVNEADS